MQADDSRGIAHMTAVKEEERMAKKGLNERHPAQQNHELREKGLFLCSNADQFCLLLQEQLLERPPFISADRPLVELHPHDAYEYFQRKTTQLLTYLATDKRLPARERRVMLQLRDDILELIQKGVTNGWRN